MLASSKQSKRPLFQSVSGFAAIWCWMSLTVNNVPVHTEIRQSKNKYSTSDYKKLIYCNYVASNSFGAPMERPLLQHIHLLADELIRSRRAFHNLFRLVWQLADSRQCFETWINVHKTMWRESIWGIVWHSSVYCNTTLDLVYEKMWSVFKCKPSNFLISTSSHL